MLLYRDHGPLYAKMAISPRFAELRTARTRIVELLTMLPQVLPQLLPQSPKQGVLPHKLTKSQPRLFFPMFAGFSSMDAAA